MTFVHAWLNGQMLTFFFSSPLFGLALAFVLVVVVVGFSCA
jgi:hypothetical protein